MFSLRICRYSMDKLTTEVLNTEKKCEFYQGSPAPWDLTIFENLPGDFPGGGVVTLGIDWYITQGLESSSRLKRPKDGVSLYSTN